MIDFGTVETPTSNRLVSRAELEKVCLNFYEENVSRFTTIGELIQSMFEYLKAEDYRGNNGMYSLGYVKVLVSEIRKIRKDHLVRKRRTTKVRKILSDEEKFKRDSEIIIKNEILDKYIYGEDSTICLIDVKQDFNKVGVDYSTQKIRNLINNRIDRKKRDGETVPFKNKVTNRDPKDKYKTHKERILIEHVCSEFILSDNPTIYLSDVQSSLEEVDLKYSIPSIEYYLDGLEERFRSENKVFVKKGRIKSKENYHKKNLIHILIKGFLVEDPEGKLKDLLSICIQHKLNVNINSLTTFFYEEKKKIKDEKKDITV